MRLSLRRRGMLLSLTLLAVVWGGSPGAADAKRPRTCRPAGSKTILDTPKLRVYRSEPKPHATRFYACLIATKHPYSLGPADGVALYPIVTQGSLIAYQRFAVTTGAVDTTLAVRDLRSGRVLHTWNASSRQPSQRYYGIDGIALTKRGAVAWIAELNSDADRTIRYEVRKSDASGENILLDSGSDIDSSSLAATSMRAYWTKAGTDQSAALQ